MKPNYGAAASRHFNDAKCLRAKDRKHFAGADHLFGLAVECALKRILEKNKLLTLSRDGKPQQANFGGASGHCPAIWNEYLVYQGNNRELPVLPIVNPFLAWDIGDRYSDGLSICDAIVNAHYEAALAALKAMQEI